MLEFEPALRAPRGTPLYVHAPFCASKCTYCDFFSLPSAGQDLEGSLAALIAEAEVRAPIAPRTVFLGGGTPSLFSIPELRRLLDGLQRITGFRDSALEVTVECNPESLDQDKAAALLDLGVTRLSIGFQALRSDTLQAFGRVHSVDQSFRAFEAARKAGVRELNVDLIYAYPGHDLASWEADLARVLALGPEHLSAYNLTFEEETPFRRWLEQGKLQRLPEDTELALFWRAREVLSNAGLDAYEVSNYSRSGYQCKHNVNYWRNGDYLGLGPSSVSHIGGIRYGHARHLESWLETVRGSRAGPAWQECLTPEERLAETWWLGLRLSEGLDPCQARRTSGWADAESDPCERVAVELQSVGLLERPHGLWRLTARGLPLADAVARRFLAKAVATRE